MISDMVIEDVLDDVMDVEGGFVDHPDDKGGPTKFGVTKPALAQYLKRRPSDITTDQIKRLDWQTARRIYKQLYILDRDYHHINDPWVFHFIVDCGINHSSRTAARIVQQAALPLLVVDGIFGPKTINVINILSESQLSRHQFMTKAVAFRLDHYAKLTQNNPGLTVFIRGWVKRAMRFLLEHNPQLPKTDMVA